MLGDDDSPDEANKFQIYSPRVDCAAIKQMTQRIFMLLSFEILFLLFIKFLLRAAFLSLSKDAVMASRLSCIIK